MRILTSLTLTSLLLVLSGIGAKNTEVHLFGSLSSAFKQQLSATTLNRGRSPHRGSGRREFLQESLNVFAV